MFFSYTSMPLDLITLMQWLKFSENDTNVFCTSTLENKIKTESKNTKRNIKELLDLDKEFLEKAYKSHSISKFEEIKSGVKTDYLTRNFFLKYIDWYIVKPIGKGGIDTYRTFFPLYIPNTEALEQVKNYLVDLRCPCFTFDYISLTDMTDGHETIMFLGAMSEAETPCNNLVGHHWEWSVFHEDAKEIYLAKCVNCGLVKESILGDTRNHLWNENHSWRYSFPCKE